MKAFVISILILIAASALFFLPHDSDEKQNTLIVGTNAEYPPFASIVDGRIVGFDIDIARELCERLGKQMILKDMPFDALIPSATVGKVNIIAAGMTFTEERAKRVLFTTPYLSGDPLVIIIRSDMPSITSLEDLKQSTIVVNEGYTADLYLSNRNDLTVVRLPSPADAFLALKSHRADAFVTAQSTAKTFFSNNTSGSFRSLAIAQTGDNYSLIVSKKCSELLPDIEDALSTMKNDGTIDSLQKKWGIE